MCKTEEMVEHIARMLAGRHSFLWDLSNGQDREINRAEVERQRLKLEPLLKQVEPEHLRGSIEDMLVDLQGAVSLQDVGFGCAIGLLLAGQSVEATQATLKTLGLYPQGE